MAIVYHDKVRLLVEPEDPDDAATIQWVRDNAATNGGDGAMPEPPDDDRLYGRTREPGEAVGLWQEITFGDVLTAADIGAGAALTVTQPVGGWTSGSTIQATDTVWDIFRRLLNPRVPAQYTAPTLSLGGSTPLAREIGESVTPTLTPNWAQNHAGPIEEYRLDRGGTNIYTGPAAVPHTDDEFTLTANVAYVARVDHEQGPVLNDSEGNPDPAGQIAAGTVTSNTVTYLAQRRGFFGPTTNTSIPDSSAYIRSLPQSVLNPGNNSVMVVDVVAGQRGACFAYPATLRPVTSIIQQGLNIDVKAGFSEATFPVEGANGYEGIPYRVYYLITEFPFTGPERFTATI